MRMLCVVLLVFCTGLVLCYIKEKPSFLKTCYMSDPAFNQCSTQTVQLIFDNIQHGFPEIGIMDMDPLLIPEIKLLQGGDGPVALNASMVDVTITGLSKIKIISNTVDFNTYAFTTDMLIPRLRVEGVYNLKGKILVLPLTGSGDAWLQPENLDIVAFVNVSRRMEDNIQFFRVENVAVNFTIGKMSVRLNNLYNGLKSLEEGTNDYINTNWRSVAESLRPYLSRTVSELLFSILTKVFDNVPAEFFIGDIK